MHSDLRDMKRKYEYPPGLFGLGSIVSRFCRQAGRWMGGHESSDVDTSCQVTIESQCHRRKQAKLTGEASVIGDNKPGSPLVAEDAL
jgi:hypothetical protein